MGKYGQFYGQLLTTNNFFADVLSS